MSDSGRSFFDQFLGDFFIESEEHIAFARNKMLSIEAAGPDRPVSASAVDDLLRSFHSLKGLCAMVGLEDAVQVAHHLEGYLRELKRPNMVMTADGIERVVAGIDAIDGVVEAKRKSEAGPDVSMVLLQLAAAADDLRRSLETPAKPEAATWRVVFRPSSELVEAGWTVTTVREQLGTMGKVVRASPQVLEDGGVAFEFILTSTLPEAAFGDLRSRGIEYSRISGNVKDRETDERAAHAVDSTSTVNAGGDVIRVEMNRMDDLMRLIGELVISRFRLDDLLRSHPNSSRFGDALQEINISMERQLRELREGAMRIRMVPIGHVFERMRFVVRGLERELNKRIELRIDGGDTEIDKLIVERMMDPLLHLVRNAISHGLESPAERVAAGKPQTGFLRLSAKTAGDTVIVEVEDDGRGIDIERVAARARSLGWIGDEETLQPKRLLDVISAPGFTTRDEADLASGRGVGMAAVYSSVNELAGSIALNTETGKGTRFTIRLPLTLLIADSLMVTVNQQRFAIPQTAVREVLAIDTSSIKVFENNEVVPFRGGVLPLVRLARIFGFNEKTQSRLHVLVVENGGSPAGLAVDRITGQREIVVRSVSDPLVRVPGVVGATELGDGRPVLILDPHALMRWSHDLSKAEVAS